MRNVLRPLAGLIAAMGALLGPLAPSATIATTGSATVAAVAATAVAMPPKPAEAQFTLTPGFGAFITKDREKPEVIAYVSLTILGPDEKTEWKGFSSISKQPVIGCGRELFLRISFMTQGAVELEKVKRVVGREVEEIGYRKKIDYVAAGFGGYMAKGKEDPTYGWDVVLPLLTYTRQGEGQVDGVVKYQGGRERYGFLVFTFGSHSIGGTANAGVRPFFMKYPGPLDSPSFGSWTDVMMGKLHTGVLDRNAVIAGNMTFVPEPYGGVTPKDKKGKGRGAGRGKRRDRVPEEETDPPNRRDPRDRDDEDPDSPDDRPGRQTGSGRRVEENATRRTEEVRVRQPDPAALKPTERRISAEVFFGWTEKLGVFVGVTPLRDGDQIAVDVYTLVEVDKGDGEYSRHHVTYPIKRSSPPRIPWAVFDRVVIRYYAGKEAGWREIGRYSRADLAEDIKPLLKEHGEKEGRSE